jgi:hypothetical protein
MVEVCRVRNKFSYTGKHKEDDHQNPRKEVMIWSPVWASRTSRYQNGSFQSLTSVLPQKGNGMWDKRALSGPWQFFPILSFPMAWTRPHFLTFSSESGSPPSLVTCPYKWTNSSPYILQCWRQRQHAHLHGAIIWTWCYILGDHFEHLKPMFTFITFHNGMALNSTLFKNRKITFVAYVSKKCCRLPIPTNIIWWNL